MKTLTPKKVDLVSELKNGTFKDLEVYNHKLENLLPSYEAAKRKISSIDESKLKELSRVGFKLHQKENKIISEYEEIKNKITSKRNELSSCGGEFFKVLPKVLFDLGVKYDMKFLPLSEYTGEIDVNLVDKIKKFEEQNPSLLNKTCFEDSLFSVRKKQVEFNSVTYYILAPSEMFNTNDVTEVVTTRVMVDPVVIAIETNNNLDSMYLNEYVNRIVNNSVYTESITKVEEKIYDLINKSNLFFIHKWGDDFTTKRIFRSFIKRTLLPKLSNDMRVMLSLLIGFNLLFSFIGYLIYLNGGLFITPFTNLLYKIPFGILSILTIITYKLDLNKQNHNMNVITLNKNVTVEHRTEYVNRF